MSQPSTNASHCGRVPDGPRWELSWSQLSNEFTIISLRARHLEGVVTQLYMPGSMYQSCFTAGVPHFVEHHVLGSKATWHARKRCGYDLDSLGDIQGLTSADTMILCAHTRIGGWKKVCRRFRSRLSLPLRFDDETFRVETGVVAGEIRDDLDSPYFHHDALFERRMWPRQACGYPTKGWPRDVTQFRKEHVDAYLRANTVGRRMALVVAGRVKHQNVVSFAKEVFGRLPPGDPIPELRSKPAHGLIVKEKADLQGYLTFGQAISIPKVIESNKRWGIPRELMVLQIISKVLGGLYSSDIYISSQLSTSSWSTLCGLDEGVTGFPVLYFTASGRGEDLSKLAQNYIQLLRKIARRGIAPRDLEAAVHKLNTELIVMADKPRRRSVDAYEYFREYGWPVPLRARRQALLNLQKTLTSAEIKQMARQILDTKALLLVSGKTRGFRVTKDMRTICGE